MNSQPVTFTLQGETEYDWTINAQPNTKYRVIVTRQSSTHPMDEHSLLVGAFTDGKYIQTREPSSDEEAIISFVAPADKPVKIVVHSKIEESKDQFGTLAIKITDGNS